MNTMLPKSRQEIGITGIRTRYLWRSGLRLAWGSQRGAAAEVDEGAHGFLAVGVEQEGLEQGHGGFAEFARGEVDGGKAEVGVGIGWGEVKHHSIGLERFVRFAERRTNATPSPAQCV